MSLLRRSQAAVASGVSLVCATCTHYWAGVAEDVESGRCSAPGPCAGPFGGGSFELYDGPITDFARWCLRCGSESVGAVRVAGTERSFGLCAAHLKESPLLSPVSPTVQPRRVLEVLRRGITLAVPPPPVQPPKGKLAQLFAEAEEIVRETKPK